MLFSKESHGYVYKWTEKSTNKWYIGSRSSKNSHINDGYICSSKIVKPLIQSNPENWFREILWVGERQYARMLETEILQSLNAALCETSYNQTNSDGKFHTIGCIPHNKGKPHTEESIQKMRNNRSNPSDYTRKLISEKAKNRPAPNKGVPHSEETKNKIRDRALGRTHSDSTKELIRTIVTGRLHTEETKNKLKLINVGKKKSPEHTEILKNNAIKRASIKLECEHCGKKVDNMNYKKWHGGNCKLVNNTQRNIHSIGSTRTDEQKLKLKNAAKNRKRIICEYCDRNIYEYYYKKYHGINCKSNPDK